MTDGELATAHEAVRAMEARARAGQAATHAAADREAATVVYRQAVALRRALGNWIVTRATSAQQAAEAR